MIASYNKYRYYIGIVIILINLKLVIYKKK